MIASTLMAAAASAQAVTVTDEPMFIRARIDCEITKFDSGVDTRRVTYLFPDQRQDTKKPIVLVLETYASGGTVLFQRSASSIPLPPANAQSGHAPPVFRPVIFIRSGWIATLTPATESGDRWKYENISFEIASDGGKSETLRSSGDCNLVAQVDSP